MQMLFTVEDRGASIMIALLLVYVTDQADVDTKEDINQRFRFENKSGIDIYYPVINYIDVSSDNRCLSRDIFYPKSTL